MSESVQTQFDMMTKEPVSKLILKLSVPTILSMLVTNIYNLVDTAFVGRLGTSASGAVGIVFGFMALLQAIAFMFGQGSGSIISRKLGAKDDKGASEIASTGFFTAFIVLLIVEILCFIFLDPLVFALGSTETIAPYAKTYIRYILLAAPFLATSLTLNNILRYEGKAKFGMIGLMSGAVLNICGDYVFMFVFDMGIAGAGLSTCLSQIIGFSILISMFLRGKTVSKISWKYFRKEWGPIYEITSTGFPSLLRNGLHTVATVVLNYEAGLYSDAAVAAMSIVARISFFTFSIAVGIGQGFQPVSGFNYGAKEYSRLKKAYYFAFYLSEIVIIVLSGLLLIYGDSLIVIFRDDPEVVAIGARALRLMAMAQVLLPYCMITEMLYQSTGHKLGASFLSATRAGLLFIPCLLIFTYFRGLTGLQEAQPVSIVLGLLPAIYMSHRFFRNLPIEL